MTNWKSLALADGPATRVPTWIKALGANDLPERDQATKALSSGLVRDGVTFSAAAPALDALLPMVAKGARNEHRAAWICGEVFAADHAKTLAGSPVVDSDDRRAVLERAEAARSTLQGALVSDDPLWRAAAAFALAFVPGVDTDLLVAAASRSMRDDADRGATASALLALGVRGRGDETGRRALTNFSGDDFAASLSQVALALAGADVTDGALGPGLVRYWLTAIPQEAAPWGGLGGFARFTDIIVTGERRAPLAPALAEALVAFPLGAYDARRGVLAKLVLAWSGITARYADRVARVEELSPSERRIAEAFAKDTTLGIAEAGLAGNTRALRRWLGLTPPGPLEAEGPTGKPRWVEARDRIAAKAPWTEVLDGVTAGLSAAEKLVALSDVARGAYRIGLNGGGHVSPDQLREAVVAAGEAGIAWATAFVREVVSLPKGIQDRAEMGALSDNHLMAVLALLVQAKVSLDGDVARIVSLRLPSAREVLTSLPQAAVKAAALARWRSLPVDNPAARGSFLSDLAPLFDLVGSPELAREVLPALGDPMIQAFGFDPAFLGAVERAAAP